MVRLSLVALSVVLTAPHFADAAPRTAVAPIPGLACMSLKVSDAQAMDPHFIVPLHQDPSESSPAMGRASGIVLVRNPEVQQNGFVAAVLFNGRPGWIKADGIKPWVNPGGNGQRCVPSRMSDGSIGFNFVK